MSSQNSNPGNFANRLKEEVRNIVSKAGRAFGRNLVHNKRANEASRKGGRHSGGGFVPHSERARETGPLV
ncbi:hypothetical protein BCV72DRAFT_336982 [Rhizopus microsporus var. microsporus]|uniref:Conidiation-specific protein 10 n=1 Tax=Rhizopus microsporus var. microsporus TaxID=86635 RepID=A0A1X0QYS3_RHIZD|nr:hypothetical protein BCV72DRAFT_336982 [Rhizopus microsporus var. microsporus]